MISWMMGGVCVRTVVSADSPMMLFIIQMAASAAAMFSLLLTAAAGGAFLDTAPADGTLSTPEMELVTEEPKSNKRKHTHTCTVQYTCGSCGRGFTGGSGLSNHLRAHPDHSLAGPQERQVKKRFSYEYEQKLEALLSLSASEEAGVYNATKYLSQTTGIPYGTLRDWKRKRHDIIAVATSRHKKKKKLRWYTSEYEKEEQQTYLEFCNKRDMGRKVRGKWLRKTYRRRVIAGGGKTKASQGWLMGFLKRWKISTQCRTNKKTCPVNDRVGPIMEFHTNLIYGLQWSGTQKCPKYGRFPPEIMFHMDQIPIEFSGTCRKTYNRIGDRSGCRLGDPSMSDAGKRFCTIQMTIRAGGKQIVPIDLIFRRKDSVGLSAAEMAHYAALPNVRVRFQSKAWADEGVILDYLQDFRRDTKDLGEVMLGMDNHGSQQTPLCRTFMDYLNIVPVYTPANCTDVVSPCDHHVGRDLQVALVEKYQVQAARSSIARDSLAFPTGGIRPQSGRVGRDRYHQGKEADANCNMDV